MIGFVQGSHQTNQLTVPRHIQTCTSPCWCSQFCAVTPPDGIQSLAIGSCFTCSAAVVAHFIPRMSLLAIFTGSYFSVSPYSSSSASSFLVSPEPRSSSRTWLHFTDPAVTWPIWSNQCQHLTNTRPIILLHSRAWPICFLLGVLLVGTFVLFCFVFNLGQKISFVTHHYSKSKKCELGTHLLVSTLKWLIPENKTDMQRRGAHTQAKRDRDWEFWSTVIIISVLITYEI